jgi:hypothetical protein
VEATVYPGTAPQILSILFIDINYCEHAGRLSGGEPPRDRAGEVEVRRDVVDVQRMSAAIPGTCTLPAQVNCLDPPLRRAKGQIREHRRQKGGITYESSAYVACAQNAKIVSAWRIATSTSRGT